MNIKPAYPFVSYTLVCACGLLFAAAAPAARAQTAAEFSKSAEFKLAKSDLDGAIADYDRAIALEPKSVEAWYQRGKIKEMKCDLGGAIADIDHATALDPNFGQGFDWNSSLKAQMGDIAGADADEARAIALNAESWPYPKVENAGDAPPADQSSTLKISIEFHEEGEKNPSPPIRMDNHDPGAYFFVVLENISDKPVLLRTDYDQVPWFEVSGGDGDIVTVCRPPQLLGSQGLSPITKLAPKEKTVIKIYYVASKAGRGWEYPFAFPATGKSREVTIRAVLQYKLGPRPVTDYDKQWVGIVKSGLWTGRVESALCKVTLAGTEQTDKP